MQSLGNTGGYVKGLKNNFVSYDFKIFCTLCLTRDSILQIVIYAKIRSVAVKMVPTLYSVSRFKYMYVTSFHWPMSGNTELLIVSGINAFCWCKIWFEGEKN